MTLGIIVKDGKQYYPDSNGWYAMEAMPDDYRHYNNALIWVSDGCYVGSWQRIGRFTTSVYGWAGDPEGYVQDHDISGWQPLPKPPCHLL